MNYKEFSAKIKAKHPGAYDDLSDEDLARKMVAKFPQYSDVTFDEKPRGMLRKAWETAKIPGQMVEQGYKELAKFSVPRPEPTGNLPFDLIRGLPNIYQETGTEGVGRIMNEMVLHPINAAGLGAGKALEAAAPLGKLLAKVASKTSGVAPEALEAAAADATTVFKPGIEKANKLYGEMVERVPAGPRPKLPTAPTETLSVGPGGVLQTIKNAGAEAAKGAASKARGAYKGLLRTLRGQGTVGNSMNRKVVDNALQLAERGELSPRLANVGRQSLDDLYKSKAISKNFWFEAKRKLKAIENVSPEIKRANEIRATAELVDDLRNPFPITGSGGTGQFRTMAGGAAMLKNPLMSLLVPPVFSPATQGGIAAGLGAASRALPGTGAAVAAVRAALELRDRKRKEAASAQR